jgi:hypothetical protein
MKKIVSTVLSLFFVVAIAGTALSQEWKGTVKSVAGDGKSIVLETREGDKSLAVGSKTTVTGAGSVKELEGKKVTVKYSEKDGAFRATEITAR